MCPFWHILFFLRKHSHPLYKTITLFLKNRLLFLKKPSTLFAKKVNLFCENAQSSLRELSIFSAT